MTLIDKYYFNKLYEIDFINCDLFYVAFYCLMSILAIHF